MSEGSARPVTMCDVRSNVPYTTFCNEVSAYPNAAFTYVVPGSFSPASNPTHDVVRNALLIALANEHDDRFVCVECHSMPLVLLAFFARRRACCPGLAASVVGDDGDRVPVERSVLTLRQRWLTSAVELQLRIARDEGPRTRASCPSRKSGSPGFMPPGTISSRASMLNACNSSSSGSSSIGAAGESAGSGCRVEHCERVQGDLSVRARVTRPTLLGMTARGFFASGDMARAEEE
eukprot:scaffold70601_cov32-Tisochrysis_lutea.AAC.4